MKSTDIARRDRELKRQQKKQEYLERKTKAARTVGDYINELHDLFYFDNVKIYNIDMSEEILEILLEMKEELPEKQWNNVLSKAVKKSKVAEKQEAIDAMKALAEIK